MSFKASTGAGRSPNRIAERKKFLFPSVAPSQILRPKSKQRERQSKVQRRVESVATRLWKPLWLFQLQFTDMGPKVGWACCQSRKFSLL